MNVSMTADTDGVIPDASSEQLGVRRGGLLFALGLSAGLPFNLLFFTLQQWFSESHLSLQVIGMAANIGLFYSLKFVWSPFMDRDPPRPLRRLGRRRGWLLTAQLGAVASLLVMASSDPVSSPGRLVGAALLLAFSAASQEIVIDTWRIETVPASLQARALGGYISGYRIAMQIALMGAILLASLLGWHGSYLVMACLQLCGVVPTLLMVDPNLPRIRQPLSWRQSIKADVVAPFRELLARPGAVWLLLFVLLFKLNVQLADTVAAPLYHTLGFSRNQVAFANGLPALGAILVGAMVAGPLASRLGLSRGLWLSGLAQAASVLLYLVLLNGGASVPLLLLKVVVENFVVVVTTALFCAYLSGFCSTRYAMTQYALLCSLAPLTWHTLAGGAGFMAHALGWRDFYWLAAWASLPGLLLLLVLRKWYPDSFGHRTPAPGRIAA